MIIFFRLCFLVLSSLLATAASGTSLELPAVISDGMVVQSGKAIPVWGWSAPGEKVQVTFKSKRKRVKADSDGYWRTQFPASDPGGPFEIVVASGGHERKVVDVFVGDVWLVSGEGFGKLRGSPVNITDIQAPEDDQGGDHQDGDDMPRPHIRFFRVEQRFSAEREKNTGKGYWSTWKDASATASSMSYMFAQRNYDSRKVPVGIIEAIWEDTPAEAWVDARDQSHLPQYAEQARSLIDQSGIWQARFQKHRQNIEIRRAIIEDKETFRSIGVHRDDYDERAWPEVVLPFEEPLVGVVWMRKRFEWSGRSSVSAELSLEFMNDAASAFINGKSLGELTAAKPEVAIPPGTLRPGTNNITLRIMNAGRDEIDFGRDGAMVIRSADVSAAIDGTWKYNDVLEGNLPRILQSPHRMTGVLYNGMIHPLRGYPIAGVVWHQGESNLEHASGYELLLKTLIYSWRLKWDELKLPFLVVQLPAGEAAGEALEGARVELRAAQQNALAMTHTALAATLDLNDEQERNEVAIITERLWRLADTTVFGNKDRVGSGPVLKKGHRRKSEVVLEFESSGEGLVIGGSGEITFGGSGLELVNDSGVLEPLIVEVDGNTIRLEVGDAAEPITVRYAWSDKPEANLYNSEGLPAYPFQLSLD